MAATRDYYEILGLSRTASERDVKSAFRRLARELHPDVSDHPEAEARFREAAEAYEVLSKPETRQLYDRYGHEGLRSGGYRPSDVDFANIADFFSAFFGDDLFGRMGGGGGGRRAERGADLLAEVEIELAEAATATTRSLTIPVAVACSTCGGNGAAPGTSPEPCSRCGGSGRLQTVSSSVFGQFVRAQACPECGGSGSVLPTPCPDCRGAGRVSEERSVGVEIPAGIHDGQRIRLTGEGHAGARGGPSGDLYVHVHVRADDRFVRDGDDVVSTVVLTMTQAALGASVTVPTLDGDHELEIAPGTQPGEVLVLRGRGMPVLQGRGRGDHRLVLDVVVPRRLDEEQRELLRRFEESAGAEAYEGGGTGFFDRLKATFR